MSDRPIKFKIDVYSSSFTPFAVFRFAPSWLGGRWERMESFQTIPECEAYIEKIKNLPLYR